MARKIPLDRLRYITRERSIRRAHLQQDRLQEQEQDTVAEAAPGEASQTR
jgi:hypothetical protein